MVDSSLIDFNPCDGDNPEVFKGMSRTRLAEYGQLVRDIRAQVMPYIDNLEDVVTPPDDQWVVIDDLTGIAGFEGSHIPGYAWHCARQQELGKCAVSNNLEGGTHE